MKPLAIVIPAYKIDFFRATLDSFANQTCKNFTLYIGDDCSPANFKKLVDEYKDKIEIVYKKFETNLGGKNLVGQWTRCLEMTQGEPWLWLFSDDDIVGPHCVELFLKEIQRVPSYDIYHFDVKIINSAGAIVENPKRYPERFEAFDFCKKKLRGKIESFVVENIFSRKIYKDVGGFVNFDMAWGSDTATWICMCKEKGLKRIDSDFVFWRKSDLNITPQNNQQMCIRKLNANLQFCEWISDVLPYSFLRHVLAEYLARRMFMYVKYLPLTVLTDFCDRARKANVFRFYETTPILATIFILKFFKKEKVL